MRIIPMLFLGDLRRSIRTFPAMHSIADYALPCEQDAYMGIFCAPSMRRNARLNPCSISTNSLFMRPCPFLPSARHDLRLCDIGKTPGAVLAADTRMFVAAKGIHRARVSGAIDTHHARF